MSDILLTPMDGDVGRATSASPKVFSGSFTAEEMSFCYIVVDISAVSAGVDAGNPATMSWQTSFDDGAHWVEIAGTVKDNITAAGQFFCRFTGDVTIVGPICRLTVTPPAGENVIIDKVIKSRVTDLVVFRSSAAGGGGGAAGDIIGVTGAAQYSSVANIQAQATIATMVGWDGSRQREIRVNTNGALVTEAEDTNVIATDRIDYTVTNVTTLAWTEVVAASVADISFMDIFDSSGETMEIGLGAAGAEAHLGYVIPGGNRIYDPIPAGTRIALRAVSADAIVGEFVVNMFG